jgi:hypothetical protein
MIRKILFLFLSTVYTLLNLSGSEKPNDEKIFSALCLPPFGQFDTSEKNRISLAAKGISVYTEKLFEAQFRPFFCTEDSYSFRIMLGISGFTETGIQFVENNDGMYLRISKLWYVEKECVDVKDMGGNFVYKLSSDEAKNIKELIFRSKFWSSFWLEKEKQEQQGKKHMLTAEPRDWLFFFEGVENQQYYYASSRTKENGPYSLFTKEKYDDILSTLARELFTFSYNKIKNGEARYYKPDKKWEDLKPFEGCKAKEEKKPEAESEKITK